ncbi:Protocatechuate 3,4-dioxygenase beta subunit [Tistlia consotensis]|uniref:Protocatechuate 3,4-dioxygenase beta subunit n=1 Tax=Tistlia consotensis USBA 355 TaxID=560819 RepID=A0A1Y6BBJ1_9PROT|nr:hypothetical protein [Tistlia consotensis]SMF01763.1 Protocatechuate 3,4-dioxygenase beta subunit [Tistlia consotensis USBA 355]SNS37676.1 Protocatechuate 3,4-dioxygenase beta subunit [Tistlia consotensis]
MTLSPSRRALLAGAAGLAGSALLRPAVAVGPTWPAGWPADWPADPGTAACRAPAAATPPETEGPYFKPGTPLKQDLRADGRGGSLPGRPLDLVGRLQGRDCRPLAGAVVELWHADDGGRYDNSGFTFRGHQLTDGQGRFGFRTVVPGLYPGRTRHLHLILAPARGGDGAAPLTTQLYFPDEPRNARDGLYDPALLLRLERQGDGLLGRYDFVVG